MPPIELPMTRRTCLRPRPSVSSRYCASTMSSELYFGNLALSPSEGFVDLPWPIASGRMMKYFFASSGWPAPNSSPAKAGCQHAGAGAGGAVQHHDRLAGRLADRPVVQAHLGQDLAGVELEVLGDEAAFLRRRILGRRGRERRQATAAPPPQGAASRSSSCRPPCEARSTAVALRLRCDCRAGRRRAQACQSGQSDNATVESAGRRRFRTASRDFEAARRGAADRVPRLPPRARGRGGTTDDDRARRFAPRLPRRLGRRRDRALARLPDRRSRRRARPRPRLPRSTPGW